MTSALSERRRPVDIGFAFALALIAFLPRLYVAIAWSKEPVWDGHYYHFGAERIAEGLGYSEDVWVAGKLEWRPWIHYPVGYSAVLAASYEVFGSQLLVGPVLNAIFGSAAAVVGYLLASRWLGERRARIAGGLIALHPGLIAYSALVMTEVLSALLLSLAGLVLLADRRATRAAIGAGLLIGVAALVRPASLLALPLVALVDDHGISRALKNFALASAVSLLVISPWTFRNCQRFDGCALISTNGGWNLAIGAITKTGRFQTLRAADGCTKVSGQVQQDSCWAKVGLSRIWEEPSAWLALAPKKLAETFNHESFAFEYLHEADPVSWTEARRIAGRELATGFHRLLLCLAALGLIAAPRVKQRDWLTFSVQTCLLALALGLALYGFLNAYHPFQWLALLAGSVGLLPLPGRPELGKVGTYVVGIVFGVMLTHVIFFGEDRYHLVATPMLCIMAAAALRPPGGQGTRTSPSRKAAMTAPVLEETPSLS